MIEAVDRFSIARGVAGPKDRADFGSRWDALRAAGIDFPGLQYAKWIDWGLIGGVLPPLLSSCENVENLLVALVQFHPLWGNADVVLEQSPLGTAVVSLRPVGGERIDRDTFDAFVGILIRVLCELTETKMKGQRLSISSEPSTEHFELANVVVALAPHSSLEFAAGQLRVKIRTADSSMKNILTGYAETRIRPREAEVLRQVRAYVQKNLDRSVPLSELAALCSMSPRSLQQQLRDLGTAFSQVVDDEKHQAAIRLLERSEMPVAVVAQRVGFESTEGFIRAVRRWENQTPTQIRQGIR
jgi:AraC-like DNA-binding protein